MLDMIGGRKFVFAILAVVLGFILVLTNKIEATAFLNFVEIVGGTYVIGNVGAKITNVFGENNQG